MCADWARTFSEDYGSARALGRDQVDPGVARAAMDLFRELPAAAPGTVLLATDLHHDNVLASEREPWLAIDPKPYAGDPAYDVLQHMLNFPERLAADPGRAAELGERARAYVQRSLSWKANAKRALDVFETAARESGS